MEGEWKGVSERGYYKLREEWEGGREGGGGGGEGGREGEKRGRILQMKELKPLYQLYLISMM